MQTKELTKATPLVTLAEIQPAIDSFKNQLVSDFKFDPKPIENDEDEAIVSELGSKLNKRLKEIEGYQKSFTKPLNDEKTAIIAAFKDAFAPATLIMTEIRKAKGEYSEKKMIAANKALEEEKQRLFLEEEAIADLKKVNPDAVVTAPKPAVVELPTMAVKTSSGSSSTSFKWYGKIIDINLIPREYLLVNESMINKTIIASKGTVKIPGIENKQKAIASFR